LSRSSAAASIRFNFELNPNEIDESDLRLKKYDDPRISTFRRISIDSSDENENAPDSIRVNREFHSNEINEREQHLEKYDDPTIPTFREVSINSSYDDENAPDSIRVNRVSDSNAIISVFLSSYKDSAAKIVMDPGIHTRVEPRFFESKIKMCSIEPFCTTTIADNGSPCHCLRSGEFKEIE
jgi:hypothetical protein